MTVSCTTFLNELDLLELRLQTLEGVVDMHVLVECGRTFMGNPKRLYFEENKSRFEKWPIKHVFLRDLPKNLHPLRRYTYQSQVAWHAAKGFKPDCLLFGDLDEIPRPDVFDRFRSMGVGKAAMEFEQTMYFWDRQWVNTDFARLGLVLNPVNYPGRDPTGYPIIRNAGTHLAYSGGRKILLEKAKASGHSLEPIGQKFIREIRDGILSGLADTVPYPEEKWPKPLRENKELWLQRGYLMGDAKP